MISSTQMIDANFKPAPQLSEEVQDILHYARKAATREHQKVILDRHFLVGMFQINRLFTRLDALLKKAGASPSRLRRLYKEEKKKAEPYNEPATVLETAKLIAEQHPTEEKGQPRVEIEHLLFALLKSPDPLVRAVLTQGNVTEAGLNKALPEVREASAMRFVLYCLRETVEVVVVVLFLVIVIKQGLGEFRLIPSESMVPTLQIGDRIVVEKVSHWYRAPHRGDILVFYPPEPESILKHDPWSIFLRLTGFSGIIYDKESKIDTAFIKRVIGLPGDTVDVRPGRGVFINGQMLNEPYVNEIASTCSFINYCGPIRVPQHMYYMMGDNRNHSADSRYWQYLPENRIIGRAIFRFFPFDHRMGVFKTPTYAEKGNPSES